MVIKRENLTFYRTINNDSYQISLTYLSPSAGLIPFIGVRINTFIKKEKDIMSQKTNSDKRASKKAQILGTKKKNHTLLFMC